jgi:hypothetical protein
MSDANKKIKMLKENELIRQLNTVLESSWSKKQRAHGKWIAIEWGWMPILKKILSKYRETGWTVNHQVELDSHGKTLWIVFFDPSWKDEWADNHA